MSEIGEGLGGLAGLASSAPADSSSEEESLDEELGGAFGDSVSSGFLGG